MSLVRTSNESRTYCVGNSFTNHRLLLPHVDDSPVACPLWVFRDGRPSASTRLSTPAVLGVCFLLQNTKTLSRRLGRSDARPRCRWIRKCRLGKLLESAWKAIWIDNGYLGEALMSWTLSRYLQISAGHGGSRLVSHTLSRPTIACPLHTTSQYAVALYCVYYLPLVRRGIWARARWDRHPTTFLKLW